MELSHALSLLQNTNTPEDAAIEARAVVAAHEAPALQTTVSAAKKVADAWQEPKEPDAEKTEPPVKAKPKELYSDFYDSHNYVR